MSRAVLAVSLALALALAWSDVYAGVVAGGADATATAATAPGAPASAPPLADRRPFYVISPHGARRDDYYWLRDDSRRSPDVLAYLAAENAYRDAYMAPSAALQEALFAELIERLPPNEASAPVREHGYWYYTRFEPQREYPIHARRKSSLAGPEQVLLDGNELAAGHAYLQIGSTAVSPDGELLAYTEDLVGHREYTLRFREIASGRTLAEAIPNVAPPVVWAADSRTVLYVERDPLTLRPFRVHSHRLAAHAAPDPTIYEEQDPSFRVRLIKSRSERYLFIELDSTRQTEVRYALASDPGLRFRTALPRERDHEYHLEHLGSYFIIHTNWRAPNFRIMRAPIATSADKRTWRVVIGARANVLIEAFEVSRRFLALSERSEGLRRMRVRSWKGDRDTFIYSDEPTYAASLVHTPDIDSTAVRYEFTSLRTPRRIIDYDLETGGRHLVKADSVQGGFDRDRYVTEFLSVKARDGRTIPVSLIRRGTTALDGTAPLYQYGYGAYGVSTDPVFRSSWLSLLDRGFVMAIAHVRGGQELGRDWFEDGRLLHKRNTFTDFIDVTEYLVANRYAARDKVFASGASAGGLLIGAVANMAPQDYRGMIAYVPFVDVVTTMLDETIPLTTNEYDQWGDPREKRYYDYMLSYSPYDNVRAQRYPAMLVLGALWDSQVGYYEPAKWVARLRATKSGDEALVLSVNLAAGHGGEPGRLRRYRDTALEYAFILRQLGIVSP